MDLPLSLARFVNSHSGTGVPRISQVPRIPTASILNAPNEQWRGDGQVEKGSFEMGKKPGGIYLSIYMLYVYIILSNLI